MHSFIICLFIYKVFIFNFQQYWTVRSFVDSIFNGKTTIHEADEKQNIQTNNILSETDKIRKGPT